VTIGAIGAEAGCLEAFARLPAVDQRQWERGYKQLRLRNRDPLLKTYCNTFDFGLASVSPVLHS